MIQAINAAWKYQFLTYPNPAVGACITCNDKFISIGAHEQAGFAHAEVNALKAAYLSVYPNSELKNLKESSAIHEYLSLNHNDFFKNKEIYVTLEPCNHSGKTPSCALLLKTVGIKKVYIGTKDLNNIAKGGISTLQEQNIPIDLGICDEQCKDLLYPFLEWQTKGFTFLKLAIRKNGSFDGGYITSQDSLNLVHEIRTKIDLLVIGGNTVRIDRPTLDSRFSQNKRSPNIQIFSKRNDFDKNISLFKIENRKVLISNIINTEVNFTMIEGTLNLLEVLRDSVDMVMLFISHKECQNKSIFDTATLGYRKVHSYFINELDEIILLRK
jgi:diaminohydroxyphosphoribosylaminopyrimidine deaminase/5-amino-6-(5-phosphoribosylamino)uracil reductase